MADREKAPPSRVWSEGGAPRASKKVTPLRLAFGARVGAADGEPSPPHVWGEGGGRGQGGCQQQEK